jgi:hypothetical protein
VRSRIPQDRGWRSIGKGYGQAIGNLHMLSPFESNMIHAFPARRTIPQTKLGEVPHRPADDAWECGGCFGAIAPSLDASRPSPCSPDCVVPPPSGSRTACRVLGVPPSGRTRYGVTSCRRRWYKCRSRREGRTIRPRDSVPDWRKRLVCSRCGSTTRRRFTGSAGATILTWW